MAKAVISNRIYLSGSPEVLFNIKCALTYKINKRIMGLRGTMQMAIETIRNYRVVKDNIISIPQGRTDLIPDNYEIVDKRVRNDMPFPEPNFPVKKEQEETFASANDSCIINAMPGWGKSIVALHLARKFGQKTLIVTHTTILRDQWVKEIKSLFGIDCGVVGSGKFNIDSAIVVANSQTLVKHTHALSKEFGTVIIDEVHHAPADTFAKIIDTMYSRYRVGLSGTLKRRDGKHVVLQDYFGTTVLKPPQSNTLDPKIRLIRSGIALTPGAAWTSKINNLLYDSDYQEYIAVIAETQIAKGHSVLIIADRVDFLANVKNLIGNNCVLVTGGTTLEDREAVAAQINSGEKKCIAGSRQIFSEGISMNRLSCVILASPVAQEPLLEQIVGRVMRMHDEKLNPVVIDIQFSGQADRKQNNLRLGFYMSKGWEIENV